MAASLVAMLKERGTLPANLAVSANNTSCSPETNLGNALIHCELTTVIPEVLEKKIKNDLSLLEECFEKELTNIRKELQWVYAEIIKGNEENPLATSIQNLGAQLEQIHQLYLKFNQSFKSVDPVLRMGGYRSLIICLVETISIISKKLLGVRTQSSTILRM